MTATHAINKVARPDSPWNTPPFCTNCGHALSVAPAHMRSRNLWMHTHNGATHCGWGATK